MNKKSLARAFSYLPDSIKRSRARKNSRQPVLRLGKSFSINGVSKTNGSHPNVVEVNQYAILEQKLKEIEKFMQSMSNKPRTRIVERDQHGRISKIIDMMSDEEIKNPLPTKDTSMKKEEIPN